MAAIRDAIDKGKASAKVKAVTRSSIKGKEPGVVNPRTWNMYSESLEFRGDALAPFQRNLAALETATLDFMDGVLPLLRAPLPRVWETVEGGLAEPIRATVSHHHPHVAGGDMRDMEVRAAVEEFEARLQLKVRKPLAQWEEALETVRSRFPELERLRVVVEKRTRAMKKQEARAARSTRAHAGVRRGAAPKTRAGGRGLLFRCTHPFSHSEAPTRRRGATMARRPGRGEAGESPDMVAAAEDLYTLENEEDLELSREFAAEDRDMRLKDRQRQLGAAMDAFGAEERLLYEQLSGLCRDAAWAKSYAASALLLVKELMQEGVYDLGATLQPLPVVGGRRRLGVGAPAGPEEAVGVAASEASSVAGDVVSGSLAANDAINAAMPAYVSRTRARATLDDLRAAASRRLYAHKATASPLELQAVPEAKGSERVPPARRAAGGIPLESLPAAALRARTTSTPLPPGAEGYPPGGLTAPGAPPPQPRPQVITQAPGTPTAPSVKTPPPAVAPPATPGTLTTGAYS